MKEWHNGYRFGQEDIYCPWDVLNYVSDHLADFDGEPQLYWANSSGNATVRDMIEHSSGTVKSQLALLASGGTIEQEIIPEMTYQDLDTDDNNEKIRYLWSLLYNTGYLTAVREEGRRKEQSDSKRLRVFTKAVEMGDAETMAMPPERQQNQA